MKIYRVMSKQTSSLQPDCTFWHRSVLYCGPDRDQARIAYHEARPTDSFRGYGQPSRGTYVEIIPDAGTDDFEDDPVDGDLDMMEESDG
jgi:hypothetical protein